MRRPIVCALLKFSFYFVLVYGASGQFSDSEFVEHDNQTRFHYNEHNYKVIGDLLKIAFKRNVLTEEERSTIPTNTLDGIYSECILGFSFPCLQKKLIIFLHNLDQMKHINLLGKSVWLVRKQEPPSNTTFQAKTNRDQENLDQAYFKDIIDNQIDRFFNTHSLRLRIPQYFEDAGSRDDGGTFLNIDFSDTQHSPRQGRKKKTGKVKGMKKLMMVIGLMTCMKLTLMGPLMIGLLGLKAIKALVLAVISLTISKVMMLSKVNFQSLLGSHDWYGGGSSYGGWDRNSHESTSYSNLPYDVEPPVSYSSYTIRQQQ